MKALSRHYQGAIRALPGDVEEDVVGLKVPESERDVCREDERLD